MNIEDCPKPPKEAIDWLEERIPYGVTKAALETLQGDIPPYVQQWVEEYESFMERYEAYRKTLPFDEDPVRDCWRMFGGDWIPTNWVVFDGERYVHVAKTVRFRIGGLSKQQALSLVGEVYEVWKTCRAAESSLVKKLGY